MSNSEYIMESQDESLRLELKADPEILIEEASWAGIKPGMRVADLGCGPGKTNYHLNKFVQPNGSAVGVDISNQRIEYAQAHYQDVGGNWKAKPLLEPSSSKSSWRRSTSSMLWPKLRRKPSTIPTSISVTCGSR